MVSLDAGCGLQCHPMSMPKAADAGDRKWWGQFALATNARAYWRIGPLEIWAERTEREWRFFDRQLDSPLDTTVMVECPTQREVPPEVTSHRRFGFSVSVDHIQLLPVTAPRAIIVSSEVPFALPPKQETTVYVSSPLWVEIRIDKPSFSLLEVPVHRPSDTWFGPSTLEGELCFAGRTRARQELSSVDILPHRAISAINIRNRAGSLLQLERIKIPTPNLSVFADPAGQPWTEQVMLDRESDGDFAALRLSKMPGEKSDYELLRGPRTKLEKGLSIRSFGSIFG